MGSLRRRQCKPIEVESALAALREGTHLVRASEWPGALTELDSPGLYGWHVDASGAAQLEVALEHPVIPGLIYAGQTGATKWPSGKTSRMTLRKRVRGNHLGGTIYGSTFRCTLTAVLREPLDLVLSAPGRLTLASERRLSLWMTRKMSVTTHAFPDRDALGDLEARVLAELDPPLNLHGMPFTPLRQRLSALRAQLAKA